MNLPILNPKVFVSHWYKTDPLNEEKCGILVHRLFQHVHPGYTNTGGAPTKRLLRFLRSPAEKEAGVNAVLRLLCLKPQSDASLSNEDRARLATTITALTKRFEDPNRIPETLAAIKNKIATPPENLEPALEIQPMLGRFSRQILNASRAHYIQDAVQEWHLSGNIIVDPTQGHFNCEVCRLTHPRFLFEIHNPGTLQILWAGPECACAFSYKEAIQKEEESEHTELHPNNKEGTVVPLNAEQWETTKEMLRLRRAYLIHPEEATLSKSIIQQVKRPKPEEILA